MAITIQGKQYNTVDAGVFTEYSGLRAKVVTGVNTQSGCAVLVLAGDQWQFINQLAR